MLSKLRQAMRDYTPQNQKQVSHALYSSRLAVCEACEEFSWTECEVTGRAIFAFARRADANCPLKKWGEPDRTSIPRTAVVITCHNYGVYLKECLESVLTQTMPPTEIVVIDDASTDSTAQIVAEYAPNGVRYERIEARNVLLARKQGVVCTTAEILCFLDADDLLTPNYLEQGLTHFGDSRVGIVYSDIERFGDEEAFCATPDVIRPGAMSKCSFLHPSCLVRRSALANVDFDVELHRMVSEWFMWRRVIQSGWKTRKQRGIYRYRRHEGSMSQRRGPTTFFDRSGLQLEPVSIFILLRGRRGTWPRLAAWLDTQDWPEQQTRIVLFDLSGCERFSRQVKNWMINSSSADLRYVKEKHENPPANSSHQSARQMDALYNRIALEATTEYLMILEDSFVPPIDACRRLLEAFEPQTACVTAVCPSQGQNGFAMWDNFPGGTRQRRIEPGKGDEEIGGCRFHCVMLRRLVLRDHIFCETRDMKDSVVAFHERIRNSRMHSRVNRSCRCERLGGPEKLSETS